MKKIFLVAAVAILSACASPQTQVQVPMPTQTPQQVAQTFCTQTGVVLDDMKILKDLTPQDQKVIGEAADVTGTFCTDVNTTASPDLVSLNTKVTQVILGYISNSTIANKDRYEIGLIVAQSLVTQYLSQVQAAQAAKTATPASAASGA